MRIRLNFSVYFCCTVVLFENDNDIHTKVFVIFVDIVDVQRLFRMCVHFVYLNLWLLFEFMYERVPAMMADSENEQSVGFRNSLYENLRNSSLKKIEKLLAYELYMLSGRMVRAQRGKPGNIGWEGEIDLKALFFQKFRFTKIKLSQKHESRRYMECIFEMPPL